MLQIRIHPERFMNVYPTAVETVEETMNVKVTVAQRKSQGSPKSVGLIIKGP